MEHSKQLVQQRQRRAFRVRKRIRGTPERPRLSVVRSHKHISVQIIDDDAGKTLAAASTLDKELSGKLKSGGNKDRGPGGRQSDRRAGDRRRHQGRLLRPRPVQVSRPRRRTGRRRPRRRI